MKSIMKNEIDNERMKTLTKNENANEERKRCANEAHSIIFHPFKPFIYFISHQSRVKSSGPLRPLKTR